MISSQKIVSSSSEPDTFIFWVSVFGTGRLLLGAPKLPLIWCGCLFSCNCRGHPHPWRRLPWNICQLHLALHKCYPLHQLSQRPAVEAGFNDISLQGFFSSCLLLLVWGLCFLSVCLFCWHILNQNFNWEKKKKVLRKTHQRSQNIFNW